MEKKYDFDKENPKSNVVREPMAEYKRTTEINPPPSLIEDENEEFITTDELLEAVRNHIHELFNKK